jgi:3-deoxy-7-phosphoheptulonate synthase
VFIVMSARATEAEVNAVKSAILAEGLQPHVSPGTERVVIALVGEVGPRRQALINRFEAMPGVENVTPISRPYKLTSREFHPEGHRRRGRRRAHRRRLVDRHGGTLLGREP